MNGNANSWQVSAPDLFTANLQTNVVAQRDNPPRDSTRPTKRTMSTMETLGIRLRPPGFHHPPTASSYYHQHQQQQSTRVMHENMYAANQLTSQPHQQPWNGYGGGTNTIHQPTNHNYAGENGFLYTSTSEPVSHGESLGRPNDSVDLDPELYALQYALLYPDLYQQVGSATSHPEPDPKFLSIDYNLPGSYQYSSLPFGNTEQTAVKEPDLLAYPDMVSCSSSDYTPRSSLTFSSAALSPAPSPQCSQLETAKGVNRPKATPSPRPYKRAAPYSLDDVRKRRSTESCTSTLPTRQSSPLARQTQATADHVKMRLQQPQSYRFSAPSSSFLPNNALVMSNADFINSPPILRSSAERYRQPPASAVLPSSSSSPDSNIITNPLPRKSLKTLHSNADADTHCFDRYSNLSEEPPDLFGPLSEEQRPPPEKDMNPDDPELKPREQDIRFDNDLYTPRWVRGHRNKREGWCGICKPGRWLVLKNSAFWYDKSFSHGISAATGRAFDAPRETRKIVEHNATSNSSSHSNNADMWEGLCGSCGEWIPLISSKKKGTTWFRHAYKCQSRSRDKDIAKQRGGDEASVSLNATLYAENSPAVEAAPPALATPAPSDELLDPNHDSSLFLSVSDSVSNNPTSAVMQTMANLQTMAALM